jgi:uncharacterized protein (DUF2384 family)
MSANEILGGGQLYSRIVSELRGRHFSAAELSDLVAVSERQIHRWGAGTSRPDGRSRERLLTVNYIVDLLRDVYTDEGVEIWLHAPNRELDAQRPIDLLKADKAAPVIEAIERLRGGHGGR